MPVVFFVRFMEALSLKVAGAATMLVHELPMVSSFRCWGLAHPELPGHHVLDPEERSSCCICCLQLNGLTECLLVHQEQLLSYLSLLYPIHECTGSFSADTAFR
jgi:hypothetical protein